MAEYNIRHEHSPIAEIAGTTDPSPRTNIIPSTSYSYQLEYQDMIIYENHNLSSNIQLPAGGS